MPDQGHSHDSPVQFDFVLDPAPQAGETVTLVYRGRTATGERVIEWEASHDRLTHLIVVSRDLSFFEHVHPEIQEDGSFVLQYTFPLGGDYVLFADAMPRGAGHPQVVRYEVKVGGETAEAAPLGEPSRTARSGAFEVEFDAPNPIPAEEDVALSFHVRRDGDFADDLEPYLGAGGHVVVISEDTETYLHVHPIEPSSPSQGAHDIKSSGGSVVAHEPPLRYGPTLAFSTRFPEPGRYKLWLQAQYRSDVHTFPFVLWTAEVSLRDVN